MHETTAVLQQTSAAKAISKEMDAIRAMVDELSRSFDNLDRVSASHRLTAQCVARGLPVALRRRILSAAAYACPIGSALRDA